MASINVVLRKKANKQGQYPIAIRITKNRKSSFISTGQYISEKFWDQTHQKVKKSYPNSGRLNNLLAKKFAEANDRLLELTTNSESVSATEVSSTLNNKMGSKSFFSLAEEYLNQLKREGKHNRHSADKPHINHFKEFRKNQDISIQEISEGLIRKYQTYLRSSRKIKERTAVNHLVVLRTIFNQAIADGIVDSKYYPFGKGKVQIKFPESLKIGLSSDEVSSLENLDSSFTAPEKHAANVWLFSFYLAGMRVSDVLRLTWSDFQDGRLHYTMGKNNKPGSLKIPEKAIKILDLYRSTYNGEYVFGELEGIEPEDKALVQVTIKNAVKKFNNHLKKVATKLGIGKPLTMHIARHTFGNISGDKIPIQMLQKLYRHSSITTTINYQGNFINKDEDVALDNVVNF